MMDEKQKPTEPKAIRMLKWIAHNVLLWPKPKPPEVAAAEAAEGGAKLVKTFVVLMVWPAMLGATQQLPEWCRGWVASGGSFLAMYLLFKVWWPTKKKRGQIEQRR